MPTFQYQSVTQAGESMTGMIDAADRAEAVRYLSKRGEAAVRIEPMGGGQIAAGRRLNGSNGHAFGDAAPNGTVTTRNGVEERQGAGPGMMRARMSKGELAGFIRETATALEAGLPLMHALKAMAKQSTGAKQEAMVLHLMRRIEGGRSLAQAAAEWGAPFNDMIIGMLRAGEASGRLDKVMLELAALLDRDAEVRRSVVGALVYPAILIVLLAGGVLVVVTFTVPRVLAVMEGQNMVLPLPTRIVQGTAEFIGTWWIFIGGAIFLGVMVWRWAMAQAPNRLAFDRFLLRVPVLGRLLRDVAVGRFARTLGTLMTSGIGVLDALVITRETLGNKAMEGVITEVVEKVRSGKSIAEPMEESGYFPPLLIQIIGLGERSGRLDAMLMQAADSFDRRTKASIQMFTTILPPMIIIVMALVVGFVLAAALLPLIEMQSALG